MTMADAVYLHNLREIVEGVSSLAEIEKTHPVLGAQLFSFLKEVRDCCTEAYGRLSKTLGAVRSLPQRPTPRQIEKVSIALNKAPDSNWFKHVSGICDRLAALAEEYEPKLNDQIQYAEKLSWNDPKRKAHFLAAMLSLLQRHERDLKEDLRAAVQNLQDTLGPAKTTGDVEDARKRAGEIQGEVNWSLDEINKITYQIQGTSTQGAAAILTTEEKAEKALRRPEIMALLAMFFLVLVFSLGAFAFQYLKFYQFVLVSGFALTSVIVIMAIYLRNVGDITEDNFLKLMELALLKFFVPLTKQRITSSKEIGNATDNQKKTVRTT